MAGVSKAAFVSPRVKKRALNPEDLGSYRPIADQSFVSKLVERAVAALFSAYAECNNLFLVHQSVFRRFHSTETVILKFHNDMVRAINDGKVTVLALLDLSSAFDSVDHDILLRVLEFRFGLNGVSLSWFHSYLTGRHQIFQLSYVQMCKQRRSSLEALSLRDPPYRASCFHLLHIHITRPSHHRAS